MLFLDFYRGLIQSHDILKIGNLQITHKVRISVWYEESNPKASGAQ